MTERIPITAGEALAHKHGYDQVIIYARRVGTPGLEWVTTYGKTKEHCAAAARIGDAIRGQVVGPLEDARERAALAEQRFAELSRGFGEAVADVLLERRRQVEAEGWTADHDDSHDKAEMAAAALNYTAAAAITVALGGERYKAGPPLDSMGWAISWRWAPNWWKPGTVRRMLVKAAALIIAEIERLDRAAARKAVP